MRARDRFFGIGEADTSVPVFDGPLKPDNRLESAAVFLEAEGLDDLCVDAAGRLFVSAGDAILSVDGGGAANAVARLSAPIQALTAYRDGLAAATRDSLHFVGGQLDGKVVPLGASASDRCVNALGESPQGNLLISDGSAETDYADWSRDLLSRGRTGRLLEYSPDSGEFQVRSSGMAYCYGVCAHEGGILGAESWRHRVVLVRDGKSVTGFGEIPGYPSRIVPASGGGFWLTVFAPRCQLLEFVLREDGFRQEMMATVEPRYWVAPALSSGQDFLEPLQQGSVRQMGILKPWAPPRSYGLVIRLGRDLSPQYSVHSRVGGRRHGITAVVEFDGALLALSKGSGSVVRIPLSEIEK
jgi:hypothetical protein